MPVRRKLRVGDSVYYSSEVHSRIVEKVIGEYLKLSNLGGRHSSYVERADYRRYGKKNMIETVGDLHAFFSSVPKELASKSKLLIQTHGKCDFSSITNFSDKVGGLSGLKKWSAELIENKDLNIELDTKFIATDKLGFRNHIVLDLFATRNNSTLSITLESTSDNVHLIPKLNKVESIIRKELEKGAFITEQLKLGVPLKQQSIEYPDEKLSFTPKEIDALTMVESLIRRCLLNWPKKVYGTKISLNPDVWRSNPLKYEDIRAHMEVVLNLIDSDGYNIKLKSD